MLSGKQNGKQPNETSSAQARANDYRPAIIMLTRVPVGGTCKTRMSSVFSPEERDRLQQAMLADELSSAAGLGCPTFVFYTPDELGHTMAAYASTAYRLTPQIGNSLGERMENAFEQVFFQGYTPCVLIGSDAPQLTSSLIERAFSVLEEKDAAIIPTLDGGYCLIGLRKPTPSAFPVIEYGTENVLKQTCKSLEQDGASFTLLESCPDVDTPADLLSLMETVEEHDCPCTYQFAIAHSQQLANV